jgi:cation diffusion facilitator family transporter
MAGSAAFRAGLVAVAAGTAVLALKAIAGWRTQSLALLAEAAATAVEVVAAWIAAASIRHSGRPVEAHGSAAHGPFEYVSAGIEGALIVLAAFVVAFEAMARFGRPPRTVELALGLALALVATGGDALLARHLLRAGRQERSADLVAHAIRLRGGVTRAVVVLAGCGIAWSAGYWPLDALVAIGVAFHILVAGLRAFRHSVTGLMDEALPGAELEEIESRLRAAAPPVVEFRDLRTRRAGSQVAIELQLVIRRDALVTEAHAACERVEADLATLYPGARVTIHVVPEGEARRLVAVGD